MAIRPPIHRPLKRLELISIYQLQVQKNAVSHIAPEAGWGWGVGGVYVALPLVVLIHFPYDIQSSFVPNGHIADMKDLVVCLKIIIHEYSSLSFCNQLFSVY